MNKYRVSFIVESDDVDPGHLLDAIIEVIPDFENLVCADDMIIDEDEACVSDIKENNEKSKDN